MAHPVMESADKLDSYLIKADRQTPEIQQQLHQIQDLLADRHDLSEVPSAHRWQVRQSFLQFRSAPAATRLPPETVNEFKFEMRVLQHSIEYVPMWVVVETAVVLRIGTTIG